MLEEGERGRRVPESHSGAGLFPRKKKNTKKVKTTI